jgi:lipoprotein-anchoring transpeptidase ErfK/SrfK
MSLSAASALLVLMVAQNPPGPGAATPAQVPQRQPAAATPAVPEPLQMQVMLDRAGFSPGVIDGTMGPNTRKALDAYRTLHGSEGTAAIDAVTMYRITAEDAAGPFTADIPADLVEQSKLPALGYRSIVELLAERFHSSPALLQRLNPGATFAEGDEILVPNVEPLTVAAAPAAPAAAQPGGRGAQTAPEPQGTSGKTPAADITARPEVIVTVSKSASALTVKDGEGRVVMYAPVTTGSQRDPLPLGEWKVNGVQLDPPFRYNPELFWDADPSHAKATVPPGPNNPVGMVWIDLSKEHYGIHGTPEPSAIGRTESHGCVRLTNWDALRLAELVKPGTKVIFTR